jgi:hypothetical protein
VNVGRSAAVDAGNGSGHRLLGRDADDDDVLSVDRHDTAFDGAGRRGLVCDRELQSPCVGIRPVPWPRSRYAAVVLYADEDESAARVGETADRLDELAILEGALRFSAKFDVELLALGDDVAELVGREHAAANARRLPRIATGEDRRVALRDHQPVPRIDRLHRRIRQDALTLRARMYAIETDVRTEWIVREQHVGQVQRPLRQS